MIQPTAWARDRLHYEFHDGALLEQALTHRSASGLHNERLEFLGDAVLGLVVAEALYSVYPAAAEGALSRLRARLVRRTTLEGIAREVGLGDHLRLGGGELRAGGHQRGSILANSLEALLGAVFVDGGFEAARAIALGLLGERLKGLGDAGDLRDPKTRLQEFLQGAGLPLPVYEVLEVIGAPHSQEFRVMCRVERLGLAVAGTGASRRAAEQQAAATILEQIEDAG